MKQNSVTKDGLSVILPVMRRFLTSWVSILVMISLLLIALDAYPFARACLVVLFGGLGAFAGYRLHYRNGSTNPYQTLRRHWKLPRTTWIACVAFGALMLSIWLFVNGVSTDSGTSGLVGLYFASANGFYFFAMVYGIGGLISTSDAKLRLKQAGFDQKQEWRAEAALQTVPKLGVRTLIETVVKVFNLSASQLLGVRTESDSRN